MIFSIDRFHRKQEHDFGLDGWGIDSTPKEPLSQDQKIKLIREMKDLEKKASMLKGQRCDCYHPNDYYDLGLDHTCSYHQTIFDIKMIKNELDSYKILEHREYRHFEDEIRKELKTEAFFKVLPLILVAVGIVIATGFLIF